MEVLITVLFYEPCSYESYLQCHRENQKWLVDAAIRLICVFALDRFADFVSDQVL